MGSRWMAKSWYEHKPNRVTENEQVTILWDSQIIRDGHTPPNKPDILIKEKRNRHVPDKRCGNTQ